MGWPRQALGADGRAGRRSARAQGCSSTTARRRARDQLGDRYEAFLGAEGASMTTDIEMRFRSAQGDGGSQAGRSPRKCSASRWISRRIVQIAQIETIRRSSSQTRSELKDLARRRSSSPVSGRASSSSTNRTNAAGALKREDEQLRKQMVSRAWLRWPGPGQGQGQGVGILPGSRKACSRTAAVARAGSRRAWLREYARCSSARWYAARRCSRVSRAVSIRSAQRAAQATVI